MRLRGITKGAIIAIIIVIIVIIIGIAAYFLMAPPAPAAPKVVKVGVVLPLSGKLAETGADLRRGIEFAVDEINAKGGIKSLGGAKLVVVYGDSAGKPETGAAEAERLITEEKVVAVVGAYQSAVTKTVSEVCERYSVPCVNPDSTSPRLTLRGYKWFFRVTPHDSVFAKQHVDFIKWLEETYGVSLKRIAIIHEDTEWGASTAEAWKEFFSEAGYEIVAVVSYHAATVTSLDAEVEKLKAANPDVLLAASYVSDAILLVKTMKAKNFAPKVVLAQDAGFINPVYVKEVGKDGWYIFSREVFNWDLFGVNPRLKEVNDRYRAKYGVDLNGNSARDYTGIWVVYYALEEAGKAAKPWEDLAAFRRALKDALEKLELGPEEIIMPWKGVKFGGILSGEIGQNVLGQGIVVQMMEDGKYHTVYPPEIATAKPIFPFPPWTERK